MQINEKHAVRNTTLKLLLGEVIFVILMFAVYVLIGQLTIRVLAGGLLGATVTVLNFLVMALSVDRAADKYPGSERKVKASVSATYVIRMVVVLGILVFFIAKGWCDPLATVIPLLFVRPILYIWELILRKKNKDLPETEKHYRSYEEVAGEDEVEKKEEEKEEDYFDNQEG